MLYREIIAVFSQIHQKHINTPCGQNVELVMLNLVVFIKTNQLMLCMEIIAVCSQIHTKHINTLCGKNVDCFSVNPVGVYYKHMPLKA